MEREKVTASEATAAVRLLRNFIVSSDTAGAREKEIFQYLSNMKDTFLATDVAGRKKQSTLEDFFMWNMELCLCRDKSERWSLKGIDDFPGTVVTVTSEFYVQIVSALHFFLLSARLQYQMIKSNDFYMLYWITPL